MAIFNELFCPASIAIVGASDDKTRIGGRPLHYMISQSFEGSIYPVNAKRDKVQGLRSYPSLSAIDGNVDFVLVAVPAAGVAHVVREAAAKKAKTVMIFSSGFAEIGPEGRPLQDELSKLAKDTGVRIVGPNCLGLFNSATRFFPTFTSTIDRATPTPGGISIASQSGAYGSHIYMVSHLRGLGIRYWVTTGNEADLHVAELIRLLSERDDVHTIMAYAESIKDGPLLVDALDTARRNRTPVIFMKVGRSQVGAEAASSHTASLAGEDAIYDAVLRQHGAYRASTTEEMLDIALACRPRIYPAGKRLGVVTISGGAGVLISDAASDYSLEVAPMPEDAQAELKALLPFASPRNPVDVTAQFFNDLSLIPRFLRTMLDRGGYDGLIGFWTSIAGSPILGGPLLAYLQETMRDYPDRLFLHCILASDEMRGRYEEAGFPCFEDASRAVAAMAALMSFGSAFANGSPSAPPLPPQAEFPPGPLSELDAKRVLAQAGLPMAPDVVVTTAEEAAAAIRKVGGPVAMKILSSDILHKTDAGGVILNVQEESAQKAFEQITQSVIRHAPAARIDGVLVSPMIAGGVECILGAKIDDVFGPIVLFGLGGLFAEVLRDTSFRRAPFGPETAREMIDELQGAAVLRGKRGRPAADLDALAEAISNLSLFAAANADALESVEINPLLALPDRCIALDALIVKRPD